MNSDQSLNCLEPDNLQKSFEKALPELKHNGNSNLWSLQAMWIIWRCVVAVESEVNRRHIFRAYKEEKGKLHCCIVLTGREKGRRLSFSATWNRKSECLYKLKRRVEELAEGMTQIQMHQERELQDLVVTLPIFSPYSTQKGQLICERNYHKAGFQKPQQCISGLMQDRAWLCWCHYANPGC